MTNTTLTKPFVLSAGSLTGNNVKNLEGEELGQIEEVMIDMDFGTVAYAVISFGGFLGMGNKLFAVPWMALKQSGKDDEFILQADRSTLEKAPGFDKDNWPQISDRSLGVKIYGHYKIEPYWTR